MNFQQNTPTEKIRNNDKGHINIKKPREQNADGRKYSNFKKGNHARTRKIRALIR